MSALPMLRGQDRTGDDVSEAEQGRDVADDLGHRPVWLGHAVLVDALDGEEADVRREDDRRLSTVRVESAYGADVRPDDLQV